jgi:hypothetical protein
MESLILFRWRWSKSLGFVLTPKHITELFCELLDLKPTDMSWFLAVEQQGFLIAAMSHMLKQTDDDFDEVEY